jgi:hypothetical protein
VDDSKPRIDFIKAMPDEPISNPKE